VDGDSEIINFSDEDDLLSSRLPSGLVVSLEEEFGSRTTPLGGRERSMSLDGRSESLTSKDKAVVIKELFTAKYADIGTLRKGQLERLTKKKRKTKTEIIHKENIDEVFMKLRDDSQL
jgi:hypothetical protein